LPKVGKVLGMDELKGEYDLAKSHTNGETLVFALMKTWDSPPETDEIGACEYLENIKLYHYAYVITKLQCDYWSIEFVQLMVVAIY
jgi:hypothetical protein